MKTGESIWCSIQAVQRWPTTEDLRKREGSKVMQNSLDAIAPVSGFSRTAFSLEWTYGIGFVWIVLFATKTPYPLALNFYLPSHPRNSSPPPHPGTEGLQWVWGDSLKMSVHFVHPRVNFRSSSFLILLWQSLGCFWGPRSVFPGVRNACRSDGYKGLRGSHNNVPGWSPKRETSYFRCACNWFLRFHATGFRIVTLTGF